MFRKIFTNLMIMLAVSSLQAAHHYPHEMIFLGDSISDNGNAQPSESFPPFVVSATPITDGLTFASLLGSRLGIGDVIPSTQGGLDFAYAGALVINNVQSLGNPGLPLISLFNQIDLIPTSVPRSTPVFSFGGANDFLRPILDHSFIFPSGASVADAMVTVLQKAHDKGFKTQIISNMPNLGAIPFIVSIPGLSAILTPLSAEFNAELTAQLKNLSFPVIQIDTASLFALITANPAKFGFPNGANLPVPNANLAGYMFYYDGVHPSEALDRIFAEYVFAQFKAADGFGAMAEYPMAIFRQQNTSILQQLYPLHPRPQTCECSASVFVSGNIAPLLREDTFGFSRSKGWGGDVTLGISQSLDCFLVGAAATYGANTNKCHSDFKTDLTTVSGSLFGSYYACDSYLNLIATGSWLDFTKIHRRFSLGPVRERTHGRTDGGAFYGLLNGGYNFYDDCTFSTGPIASLEYGAARVNGYRERGAAAGNLKYRHQTGQVLISGIGWEVNYLKACQQSFGCLPDIAELGLNMSLSLNRQWLHYRRNIHFKEVSIDGAYGALPFRTTRTTYFSGVANIFAELCNKAVLSAGYFFNVGTFDLSEHRITVGVSVPFSAF